MPEGKSTQTSPIRAKVIIPKAHRGIKSRCYPISFFVAPFLAHLLLHLREKKGCYYETHIVRARALWFYTRNFR